MKKQQQFRVGNLLCMICLKQQMFKERRHTEYNNNTQISGAANIIDSFTIVIINIIIATVLVTNLNQ